MPFEAASLSDAEFLGQIAPFYCRTFIDVGGRSFQFHLNSALRGGLSMVRTRMGLMPMALVAMALQATPSTVATNEDQHWVTTWSTAMLAPNTIVFGSNPGFDNQTLRQIVHTSIGGNRVRVRLSTFGAGALHIGAARIALRAAGSAIVPGTDRALTFAGLSEVVIPPGAVVLSDPVALEVPPLADVAVSTFVPGSTGPTSWHFEALQTAYVSPTGDFTESVDMPFVSTTRFLGPDGLEHDAWFWLAGVEVLVPKQTGAVAILGDSVTDGSRSTPDTNSRWPDHLAHRLIAVHGNHGVGVLNLGAAGNRLLNEIIGPNALARYDRDVLTQTGVTHVIVALGNNDILFVFSPADEVSVDQMIAGHRQLIRRARARGLKVYGTTLTPFGGFPLASSVKESKRQAVNQWIRTSGEYDAVIDFDAALRDPADPTRLRADAANNYDSGDHLHPSDAGYQAMANAIDIALFKNGEGESR
jgi:lysophospholipase L1-like esterase